MLKVLGRKLSHESGTRAIVAGGALLLLALDVLVYRLLCMPSPRTAEIQTAEYLFILLASLALIAFYTVAEGRLPFHRTLSSLFVMPLLAMLLSACVYKLGMHQFGGWDEGLLVHVAALYINGCHPYSYFQCSMPPFFMAGIRCGVMLLGMKWASFAMLAAVFTGVTSLWIYGLLRLSSFPAHWAVAVAVGVEMSTMVVSPFWWFNNASAVSVVLIFLSALACSQRPRTLLPWASLALALALILTSKPNVYPASLVMLVLLALRERWQWAKVFGASVTGMVLAWLICNLAWMPISELWTSYREIGKLRGSPLLLLPFREMQRPEREFQAMLIAASLLCVCTLLVAAIRRVPNIGLIAALSSIAILTAFESALTNSEIKTSDLSAVLAVTAVLCLRPWTADVPSFFRRRAFAVMLSVFLVMSGFFAATHLRINAIGPGMYYEPLPTRTIRSGFFSGLQAGPRLQRVLAQTDEVMSSIAPRTVFFGPRLEFGYAIYNQKPPAGMPLLWDPGNLFSRERLPGLLRAFQQDDADLLLFLKNDYTRMETVSAYILKSDTYERIDKFSELTVFIRKRYVPVSSIDVSSRAKRVQE